MKEHCSNKSYNSIPTRWVDRILSSNFEIGHLPSTKMGSVDFILRESYHIEPNITHCDEHFVVAKRDLMKRSAKNFFSFGINKIISQPRNKLR